MQLFKLYRSKLNGNSTALWQKPRSKVNYCDDNWFQNRPIGRDYLDRFMKLSLGKSVALSQEYTNHSIRATVITTLDEAGFEARHIITLSSHKSEATIKEYSTKCPENKKREMFESLSNAIKPKSKKAKTNPPATATLSKDPEEIQSDISIQDVKENLPNFTLDPLLYDTIDDAVLADLINEMPLPPDNSDQMTHQTNTDNTSVAVVTTTSTSHSQVINYNNPMQNFPKLPNMYFPHSNVTINYNFKQ